MDSYCLFLVICCLMFVGLYVAVLAVFRTPHAEASAEVVEEGLEVIRILANDKGENQTQLGELGACTGVEKKFACRPYDTSFHSFLDFPRFHFDFTCCSFCFQSPYVCPALWFIVVMAAIQSPLAESNEVVVRGLFALSSLACENSINRARLGELGACAGIS